MKFDGLNGTLQLEFPGAVKIAGMRLPFKSPFSKRIAAPIIANESVTGALYVILIFERKFFLAMIFYRQNKGRETDFYHFPDKLCYI